MLVHIHAMTSLSYMLYKELRKKPHDTTSTRTPACELCPQPRYNFNKSWKGNTNLKYEDKYKGKKSLEVEVSINTSIKKRHLLHKLNWIKSQGWHGTKIFFLCIIVKLTGKVLAAEQLTTGTVPPKLEKLIKNWCYYYILDKVIYCI